MNFWENSLLLNMIKNTIKIPPLPRYWKAVAIFAPTFQILE